jgi:hypothetical protein
MNGQGLALLCWLVAACCALNDPDEIPGQPATATRESTAVYPRKGLVFV